MRPELMTPEGSPDAGLLVDMLAMVGKKVPLERVQAWTPLEQAVACDWASLDGPNRRHPFDLRGRRA